MAVRQENMKHSLPIEAVLPELRAALLQHDEAILEAPPGAGKTTLVPLALLDAEWLQGQTILMLEPRRLAARAAAERMAELLGETVGKTVGYRVRLDSKVSRDTRIEVVTEGILIRRLQTDPALENVGLIIFDEFHERSLEADLGLALCLQAREVFRETPTLKILLMSATVDGEALSQLLGDAPLVCSEGRMYPVEIRYGAPWKSHEAALQSVAPAVLEALGEQQGSLLVFLPGQGEIRQVCRQLEKPLATYSDVILAPLYGDLDLAEQRRAIAPAPPGKRKVVLATDIAETSLTIDGVNVVIDAGLSRQAIFDSASGMTRLHTRRVSRASSIQRMGRAGRLQPGVCYRLWSETQQQQLIPFSPAEISQADLVPLALQLQRWGVDDPAELIWQDAPAATPYAQALELLARLGALRDNGKGGWSLTDHGEAMAALPTHPRLAHMLLMGKKHGLQDTACKLAVLLSERDPLPNTDADIGSRLALLNQAEPARGAQRGLLRRLQQQVRQFRQLLKGKADRPVTDVKDPRWLGFLLACAYPDRIARQRQAGSIEYRLSNGRAARLREHDPLQQRPWLAIAQMGSHKGMATDQIYLAAELDEALFEDYLAAMVSKRQHLVWEKNDDRLSAFEQRRIGRLVLSQKAMAAVPVELKQEAVLALVRKRGLELLPWTETLQQWRQRILLLRQLDQQAGQQSEWPDVSDAALLDSLENWLGPHVADISHLNHFARLDLANILRNLLPWPLPKKLDELAPEKIQVPSGSRIRIDYSETPPVLAVRLQEMFGCNTTPRIANNRLALKVHLLSPARRPVQVTQDLENFWQTSYLQVKKEMKGRYPRHHWPDDPLNAEASSRLRRKPRDD